jgi:hypothetical protein
VAEFQSKGGVSTSDPVIGERLDLRLASDLLERSLTRGTDLPIGISRWVAMSRY